MERKELVGYSQNKPYLVEQLQDKPTEKNATGGDIRIKLANLIEMKEQVEQLQDKPSEETITEGEIRTDVGKQATYLDNFIETKEKWEQLKEQLEQLQEQLETASGGEIETDSEDFMELKERVEQWLERSSEEIATGKDLNQGWLGKWQTLNNLANLMERKELVGYSQNKPYLVEQLKDKPSEKNVKEEFGKFY